MQKISKNMKKIEMALIQCAQIYECVEIFSSRVCVDTRKQRDA